MVRVSEKRRPRYTGPRILEATERELLDDEAVSAFGAPFLESVEAVIHDPTGMLLRVSEMIAVVDPRNAVLGEKPDADLASVCEALLSRRRPQTDALAAVIGQLADAELGARIHSELVARRAAVPGWVRRLGEVRPYRALLGEHVLGDGDNVFLGVRLPGHQEATFVVYIDHNLGTVVKDAFVLDGSINDVVARFAEVQGTDPALREIKIGELSLADARQRIREAVDRGARTYPPYETETWPGCRPLLDWLAAKLPEGGSGFPRPKFTKRAVSKLVNSFFASSFGAEFDDDDHRELLDSTFWFGTDYGPGDPLRWSGTAVEILLLDWIPRKLAAPVSFLSAAPDLLRALIRFSHAERGINATLTRETLLAVDAFEPEYLELISQPRHQGPMAILDAMGLVSPDEPPSPLLGSDFSGADGFDGDRGFDADRDFYEWQLDELAYQVGGRPALDELDVEPLPDEQFDLDGIDADVHARVAEILALVEGAANTFFDAEFATASRRLLSLLARVDPAYFRRRIGSAGVAATICWIIGTVNNCFSVYGGANTTQVKQLLAHFSLTGGVSQKADRVLSGVGLNWHDGRRSLQDPSLLTSSARRWIIAERDALRARL